MSEAGVARGKRDLAGPRFANAQRAIAQPWVWVGALTLVGLLLRRYHLGTESLWFDEADIAQSARRSLPALIESFTRAGENGPLYTLLLHYWLSALDASPLLANVMRVAFGHTDEALVRGPAALFGAAAIPLMYMLGRRVGGVALGLVSAALLAFDPFAIWHSQDAKMYTLLVLMTLATSLLYLTALERNTPALWIAYVLAAWAMLTVHSMAALVFLAQLAVGILDFGLVFVRGWQSKIQNPGALWATKIIRWGWAMLLVVIPALPIAWLRAAALLAGTDVGGWYTPTGLGDILGTIFIKFAVNQAPPPWEAIGAVTMGVLALVGLFWISDFRFWNVARRTTRIRNPKSEIRNPKSLVLALWIVPILLFWLVTLQLPLFQPRYLIMALPSYLIMAGAGLLALRRLHPVAMVAAAALLGAAMAAALLGVNYSAQAQKEDWRGAMAYVQDHLRGRDVIVAFPGYMVTAVNQYYRPGGHEPQAGADVPLVDIKTLPSLGTKGFGEDDLNARLLRSMACHERAWLVTSPVREAQEDPKGKVREWFQYNWHTFDTKEVNGVIVYGISFNGQPNCWYPEPDHKEFHSFTNGLDFLGYIYELRREDNTQPDASYFPLTLYWHNFRKIDHDYDVRVVVKDPSGKIVVDEALGPLNGYWPTTQWPPDTQVIDYRDLRLPGGLTPGGYTISLQVYPRGEPRQPLTLNEGGTWIEFKEPLKVVRWQGE